MGVSALMSELSGSYLTLHRQTLTSMECSWAILLGTIWFLGQSEMFLAIPRMHQMTLKRICIYDTFNWKFFFVWKMYLLVVLLGTFGHQKVLGNTLATFYFQRCYLALCGPNSAR